MNLKQFGEQLRTLRKQAGWSQEQLIEALDQLARPGPPTEYRVIDSTLLSRWEHARIQNRRQWKPTRTYTLHLIRLFASYLDLERSLQWAAQAGYSISPAELQVLFPILAVTALPMANNPQANERQFPQPQSENQETSPTWPHNLPVALTSFVGRQVEISHVTNHLTNATTRLITLVGEGGVGKTRLALQVAYTVVNQRIGAFTDGVYFVSLSGVSAANVVVSTLMNDLGFSFNGAADPEQQLLSQLGKRRLLLVLDNFEHLVDSVTPLVANMLTTLPGVHLVVTSRERLNLAGERVLALNGLPFTPLTGTPPLTAQSEQTDHAAALFLTGDPAHASWLEYEAGQLFMERARQTDAEFGRHLKRTQRQAVLRICTLLQGIPLGIEMAAAWVYMLSCDEIADEIAKNLDFLTSPQRNAPARHRSMRAVFEHSWRLLTPPEQAGLAALAIFQGGFTRQAAAIVAQTSLVPLRSLVDKSLLRYRAEHYAMHELLRQFAEEQLQLADGESTTVAERHSAYYLQFVAQREQRLEGYEARQAAAEMNTEFSNIRQAWAWAVAHLRLTDLESSCYALWCYFLFNGSSSEGESLVIVAIDQIKAAGTSARQGTPAESLLLSKLLTMRAMFLRRLGHFQQALSCAEEAIAAAGACLQANKADPQHQAAMAFAHWICGFVLKDHGEYKQAQTILEAGQQLLAAGWNDMQSDAWMSDVGWLLYLALGANFIEMNDYPRAREYVSQALHLCQSAGKVRGILTCLGNLGWLELLAGDYPAARLASEKALPLARIYDYRLEEAVNLILLGGAVRRQGEYGLAQALLTDGWQVAHEIKAYLFEASAMVELIYLYSYLGDYPQAQRWLDQRRSLEHIYEGELELARVLLALQQGIYGQALEAANHAWRLLGKHSNLVTQSKSLLILAHAQAGAQLWTIAADTYAQVLRCYTALNRPALAVEARAGLAAVALHQGDLTLALQQVEAILPVLAEAPYVGSDEPFYTYWHCYRVLTAVQDQRAGPLLESANQRLEYYANHIDEEELRHAFWENVAVHRNLRTAYLQQFKGGDWLVPRAELEVIGVQKKLRGAKL